MIEARANEVTPGERTDRQAALLVIALLLVAGGATLAFLYLR